MATKKEQIEFVRAVYPPALSLREKQDGIHPLFVTAQAALETGWKLKTDGTNNLFGITKGSSWKGPTKLCLTTESFTVPDKKFYEPERVTGVEKIAERRYKYRVWRLFRVYRSMEECLDDHLSVLRKTGYADAWPYRNDPKEYARRISDYAGAKYATAENYAAAMIATINSVEKLLKELKL
jgi:flagellar protein FlgJ